MVGRALQGRRRYRARDQPVRAARGLRSGRSRSSGWPSWLRSSEGSRVCTITPERFRRPGSLGNARSPQLIRVPVRGPMLSRVAKIAVLTLGAVGPGPRHRLGAMPGRRALRQVDGAARSQGASRPARWTSPTGRSRDRHPRGHAGAAERRARPGGAADPQRLRRADRAAALDLRHRRRRPARDGRVGRGRLRRSRTPATSRPAPPSSATGARSGRPPRPRTTSRTCASRSASTSSRCSASPTARRSRRSTCAATRHRTAAVGPRLPHAGRRARRRRRAAHVRRPARAARGLLPRHLPRDGRWSPTTALAAAVERLRTARCAARTCSRTAACGRRAYLEAALYYADRLQ